MFTRRAIVFSMPPRHLSLRILLSFFQVAPENPSALRQLTYNLVTPSNPIHLMPAIVFWIHSRADIFRPPSPALPILSSSTLALTDHSYGLRHLLLKCLQGGPVPMPLLQLRPLFHTLRRHPGTPSIYSTLARRIHSPSPTIRREFHRCLPLSQKLKPVHHHDRRE